MKHYNIPIFISHFGCPNACVFCNQKKINGRETDVTMEDLKETIETYLSPMFTVMPKFLKSLNMSKTDLKKTLIKNYTNLL